jgi:hypothetical protein
LDQAIPHAAGDAPHTAQETPHTATDEEAQCHS